MEGFDLRAREATGSVDAMASFTNRVYALVRRVPRGRIISYGGVAAMLGRPRAARGVGHALSALPEGSDVPWWRVVNRDGAISMRGAGPEARIQRALLEAEGVVFDARGRAGWERFGWHSDEPAPKPVREAVSVVIRDRRSPSTVLQVRRPPDDEDLPDAWGLPAASRRGDESWEATVRRAGWEKLGVRLRVGRVIGEGTLERTDYVLHMRLYEASITGGRPAVPQAHPAVTQYTALAWARSARLRDSARRGSLCSRLLLAAESPAGGRRGSGRGAGAR